MIDQHYQTRIQLQGIQHSINRIQYWRVSYTNTMSNRETPLHVVTGTFQTIRIRDLYWRVQTQTNCPSRGNFHLQTSSPKVHISKHGPNLQAPQSPQEKLERFFDQRPSPTELKQRNILKDSKLAPSLQSAQVSSSSTELTLGGFGKKASWRWIICKTLN